MVQFLIYLTTCVVLASTRVEGAPGLWDIHISNGPAPPPDEGPPLSANAVRDPAQLKFELIAIFGTYLGWILLTLLAIFFTRRRLRRLFKQPSRSYKMDVLKFKPHMVERQLSLDKQPLSPKYSEHTGQQPPMSPRSPKSPRLANFKSWAKGHRSNPSETTIQTIDSRVVDHDKAKNMDEMTKLYAAVMAHDEERSLHQTSPSLGTETSPKSSSASPTSQFSFPEFQHLRNPNPTTNQYEPQPQIPEEYDERYGPTPSSFISAGTTRVDSAASHKSQQSRISIKGRPISRPVAMADLEQSVAYGLPSSPRMFSPGPPPPVPGSPEFVQQQQQQTHREFQRRGPPKPLPLKNDYSVSSKNLPFRQMYAESLQSAPPTKTTFLERKVKDQGPMTGVPYSPYTPFTPMTPITPRRLPTKQELKESRKKGTLTSLREDGLVKSDDEQWN